MSETKAAEAPDRKDLLKRALVRMAQLERELQAERARAAEPIAIIGIGCRFPGGASDPERFRELLYAGFDATCEIPGDRWDVDAYFDPDPESTGTMYVRRGAFLTDPVDRFDAAFFGIAPREADEMDPQQRLLTEVVWETLEHGGQSPDALRGSATGVFVGMAAHDWSRMQAGGGDTEGIGTYYGTGSAHSVAAGRISYLLGLKGPALTIDTACSSSLIAMHEACQSLRAGETEMAIAAGVSLILAPDGHVIASRGRMLSPRGFCSTFDASADGYVRGEGCAVVVMKRLSDARAAGDRILAVVRGTAANQDGRSGGLTVPSGTAQEEVMRTALSASGLQPAEVDFVEAHGTGTELGDPIEVHALAAVHAGRPAERPLLIGSVKTNVGHLEGAAGLAGVIKTVIALGEEAIPPHLHFETPNPHISWESAPIAVTATATPWPRADRRVAGVSSFGFSGTNVHVVLEAPPAEYGARPVAEAATADCARSPLVMPISARDRGALAELAGRLAGVLERDASIDIEAVARTAARGRAHWEERAAIVAGDREELLERLRRIAAGDFSADAGLAIGTASRKRVPGVAFLFTGQGAQRAGMGRELLASEPVFREIVERCDAVLTPRIGVSIAALMRAADDDAEAAATLRRTEVTQPALFVLEVGLAELWRSWGVEPRVVLGHSIGEFAAAYLAGVLPLEAALGLVIERARLMGSLPAGGAMATLFANEERVRGLIAAAGVEVDVAAVNAPGTIVISGSEAGVGAVLERAAAEEVQSRRLEVSHAFHSRRMESIVEPFRAAAAGVPHAAPTIDVIAAATGERAGPATLGADYWARQIREPVLFARSVEALRAEGTDVLVEVGPAPVLLSLAASCPGANEHELRQPSLRPGSDASRALREALAALYVAGVPIDWSGVYPGPLDPVALPSYPFQRSRHWFQERRRNGGAGEGVHPLLGRRIESPLFSGTLFEVALRADDPAWVAEHRVFDRPVLPAAAYVEICRAAIAEVVGEGMRPVRLRIQEALTIQGETRVQTIVDPGAGTLTVSSRNDSGEWRTHAEAGWEAVDGETTRPEIPLFGEHEGEVVDVAAMLASIEENGVAYGPAFRGLREVRRIGGAAVGTLSTAAISGRERRRYGVHPALLDAAFQLCGACVDASDAVYLPVEVASVEELAGGPESDGEGLRAAAILREGDADAPVLVCDVEVVGAEGGVRVRGLRFQKVHRAAPSVDRQVADWLYTPGWERVELEPAGPLEGRFFVLGQGDLATAVRAELESRGGAVLSSSLHDSSETILGDHGSERLAGIVVVAEDTPPPATGQVVAETLRPTLAPALDVARAVASGLAAERIVLVTRGACEVRPGEVVNPGASALWALGHTVAAEIQNVRCLRLDLGGASSPGSGAAAVADALTAAGREDRLALRADGWHAMRLERIPPLPDLGNRPGPDYQLEIGTRGALDTLALGASEVEAASADQVTIRVEATGLNFRDVLNALDMYPGDAGPLGSECVGVVEKVGAGVHDLKVGDRVMSITPRGFCSRVNSAAVMTVPMPRGLTASDAASIPIAFLTADWGLFELANLSAGERVLIHAAAGGVGQAAVQLAMAAGAEVYATAGSPRKRALLARMGVRHVYDSRSTAFREEIHRDTAGAGVDVVLNSLADEFIPASLDVLAEHGRFIEIGKTGVWDRDRVAGVRPRARYEVLYLGEACDREPERVRQRFLRLVERFESGELRPLPARSFLVDDAIAAFRYMAQARHIGKVVLHDSLASLHEPGSGAIWITGGLGGVGLAIARRLAEEGYRRLVLTGRREPTEEVEAQLDAVRGEGAEVAVLLGDVGHLEEVERIRDAITARGWRIDQVYHAAALLDDAVLTGQSWERFERVIDPKAGGAWNLHLATRMLPLRAFVLFSAGAGLLGSPGQANYAAANGFLDGLARLRRSEGLPATSVLWGPWTGAGMAARAGLDWTASGLGGIDAERGVAALRRVVTEEWATPLVLPVDWSVLAGRRGGIPPLFAHFAGDEAHTGDLLSAASVRIADLIDLPEEARRARIDQYVLQNVSAVLGIRNGRLQAESQIMSFGFDSLMAVELRNRIESDLGVVLPAASLLNAYTAAGIGELILESIDAVPVGGGDAIDAHTWEDGEI